jgi:SET domain-containing protein
MARPARTELVEVRDSRVHGKGAFAIAPIAKGTRLIEYVGERVSHKEADRRYESKDANDNHTFLFIVDARTVIDAGVDGNDARFFNHSCDPNCESVIENGRVYIETIRAAQPGEELTYDYQIQREADDPPDIDEIFACRCGAPQCRGTMLWPAKRKPAKRPANKAKRKKAVARKDSRRAVKKKKRAARKGGRGR